jgi:hypothetical protein
MGDIGEVWNVVTDTVTLFQNGHSQNMGNRAFACPKGVNPGDLDWSNGGEHTVGVTKNRTNRAKDWFDLSSGSRLRLGCTWNYGGTSSEHPGLYLHDAYLWAVVDYVMLGENYTVTGGFGDAVPHGNSAELSGWINVDLTQFRIDMAQWRFDIRIRGNGYGVIRAV